jgi:hypothetical protein
VLPVAVVIEGIVKDAIPHEREMSCNMIPSVQHCSAARSGAGLCSLTISTMEEAARKFFRKPFRSGGQIDLSLKKSTAYVSGGVDRTTTGHRPDKHQQARTSGHVFSPSRAPVMPVSTVPQVVYGP